MSETFLKSLLHCCFLFILFPVVGHGQAPRLQAHARCTWVGNPPALPSSADTVTIFGSSYLPHDHSLNKVDRIIFRGEEVRFNSTVNYLGRECVWRFPVTTPDRQGTFIDTILVFGDGRSVADTVSVKFRVSNGLAKWVWEEKLIDKGVVRSGDEVKMEWRFRNESENALYISTVKSSCGCVAPIWDEDVVMPGEVGKVGAQFNSQGRVGANNKCISITYNGNPPIEVACFKVVVEPRPEVNPSSMGQEPPVSTPAKH